MGDITSEQVRAARALLRLSQDELAQAAGLTPRMIQNVEQAKGVLGARRRPVARCLEAAFANAGVVFTEGQGVRLQQGVEK